MQLKKAIEHKEFPFGIEAGFHLCICVFIEPLVLQVFPMGIQPLFANRIASWQVFGNYHAENVYIFDGKSSLFIQGY